MTCKNLPLSLYNMNPFHQFQSGLNYAFAKDLCCEVFWDDCTKYPLFYIQYRRFLEYERKKNLFEIVLLQVIPKTTIL